MMKTPKSDWMMNVMVDVLKKGVHVGKGYSVGCYKTATEDGVFAVLDKQGNKVPEGITFRPRITDGYINKNGKYVVDIVSFDFVVDGGFPFFTTKAPDIFTEKAPDIFIPKVTVCKHEFITMFTSISCKHCGVDIKELE